VSDAASHQVIALLRGDELTALRAAGATTPIAPGGRDVLYLDLLLPSTPLPASLLHRIEYRVADDRASSHVVEGARSDVATAGAIVLGAPLRGGPWAAIHHARWPRGHRRVIYSVDGAARIPGRHAIDWVKVDAQGRIARGDADLSANHLGLGAEVLAVADARVVALRDDLRESERLSSHPDHALGDASGNFVALELREGRFAIYEHLQPGSVRVRIGQTVKRGEVVGRLGFTGDSTGPHLHFHVADAPSPLAAEGLPFAFEGFTLLGRYDDIATLGSAPWQALAAGVDALRRGEAPGANVVVDFGTAAGMTR
jgi:murein DD-endopeptidase